MNDLDKVIAEIDRVHKAGRFYKAMDCFTVLEDLKKFVKNLQKEGGCMEKTIKIDFQIGEMVTTALEGSAKGQVSSILLEANDQIKYWVDFVSTAGEVNGKWLQPYQLKKLE